MDIFRELQGFILVADKVFKSVLAERNKKRIEEAINTGQSMYEEAQDFTEAMLHDAGEISKLLVEVFSDVLRETGHNIPESRSMVQQDIREHFEKELTKRLTILPYSQN